MVLTSTRPPAAGIERAKITSGHGCYLETDTGRKFFDGCSGAVNVNLGHTHPAVLDAIVEQASRVHFTWRARFTNEPVERLRDRLTALSGRRLTHHLISNSGSDGLEQAFRVAWRYHHRHDRHTRRTAVLAESASYHGMTSAALGASGHRLRHNAFGASMQHLQHTWVPTPEVPGARATAQAWIESIDDLGDSLAAVVVEPVGGAASGAAPHTPETLAAIRAAATRAGALVIADEVMTGLGRTGDVLTSDALHLDADVVVVSKGLGAGYIPIAACMVADPVAAELSDAPDLGTFGHTMAESPLAAAAALAVLDTLDSEDIIAGVAERAEYLHRGLVDIASRSEVVGPPRGRGLLQAVAVRSSSDTAHRTAELFAAHCGVHDLALYPAGVDDRTSSVLVTPPLNTTIAELDDLLSRLDAASESFLPGKDVTR